MRALSVVRSIEKRNGETLNLGGQNGRFWLFATYFKSVCKKKREGKRKMKRRQDEKRRKKRETKRQRYVERVLKKTFKFTRLRH